MAGAPIGNDNASKGKPWRDALDRAIKQDDGKRLRGAAEKLLDAADAGEPWAVKELADRLDGKAAQSATISNPDGSSLLTGIKVVFVRADSEVP